MQMREGMYQAQEKQRSIVARRDAVPPSDPPSIPGAVRGRRHQNAEPLAKHGLCTELHQPSALASSMPFIIVLGVTVLH